MESCGVSCYRQKSTATLRSIKGTRVSITFSKWWEKFFSPCLRLIGRKELEVDQRLWATMFCIELDYDLVTCMFLYVTRDIVTEFIS